MATVYHGGQSADFYGHRDKLISVGDTRSGPAFDQGDFGSGEAVEAVNDHVDLAFQLLHPRRVARPLCREDRVHLRRQLGLLGGGRGEDGDLGNIHRFKLIKTSLLLSGCLANKPLP